MASSILSTSSNGHILPMRAEAGTELDVSEPLESAEELEFNLPTAPVVEERWSLHKEAGYSRSSEAFEMWELLESLPELPTQSGAYVIGKRAFDLALAVAITPILAVTIGTIAAMIAMTSGTSVFYRQRRIGQHGREFFIWKFRTMHRHADWILAEHLKKDAVARDEWTHTHKLRDDPRTTKLGRFLRKTSLDELPQILNVFSGEMSFVGPRPIVHAEVSKYAERFAYYLSAVPGITGLWQVSGRSNISYEARVILDETYVRKWSLGHDLWILCKTPRTVFNRDGAY